MIAHHVQRSERLFAEMQMIIGTEGSVYRVAFQSIGEIFRSETSDFIPFEIERCQCLYTDIQVDTRTSTVNYFVDLQSFGEMLHSDVPQLISSEVQ